MMEYGHYLCYIIVILVSLLDRLTMISIIYLLFIFSCLLIHFNFHEEISLKIISKIWGIIVIFR